MLYTLKINLSSHLYWIKDFIY